MAETASTKPSEIIQCDHTITLDPVTNRIHKIIHGSKSIGLQSAVRANGTRGAKKGTLGMVMAIRLPLEVGVDKVLQVQFEGRAKLVDLGFKHLLS